MAKIAAASNATSLSADTEGFAATISVLVTNKRPCSPMVACRNLPLRQTLGLKPKFPPTNGTRMPQCDPLWFGTWFANS
jgi:hypothetical protein